MIANHMHYCTRRNNPQHSMNSKLHISWCPSYDNHWWRHPTKAEWCQSCFRRTRGDQNSWLDAAQFPQHCLKPWAIAATHGIHFQADTTRHRAVFMDIVWSHRPQHTDVSWQQSETMVGTSNYTWLTSKQHTSRVQEYHDIGPKFHEASKVKMVQFSSTLL